MATGAWILPVDRREYVTLCEHDDVMTGDHSKCDPPAKAGVMVVIRSDDHHGNPTCPLVTDPQTPNPRIGAAIKLLLDKAPRLVEGSSSSSSSPPAPPVFVITTKGKEFALELLAAAGLGGIPPTHVYGLGSGKKVDVLASLLREHGGETGRWVGGSIGRP
jgi:hypothetical protein